MSTATAHRTARPPAAAPPRPTAGRGRRVRDLALALLAAGVVAGGTWGLLVPREAPHTAHVPAGLATVQLSDGTLRVEGLVDKQVGHVMPGMGVAEDVAVGKRRIAVNVTLGATEGRSLAYSRRDFVVSGPGVEPVVPVAGQLDAGALTPGQALSGSLSFDVPKDSTMLSLQFRSTAPVALPALPPLASSANAGKGAATGHGGGHDADKVGGAAPAAPAAPDHPHAGTEASDRH